MELIGIPHRVVISDRGLQNGTLEYKGRSDAEREDVTASTLVDMLKAKILG